jgi:gamma-glutamyl-gamma-aminobutyraldehyde dehydrogenase
MTLPDLDWVAEAACMDLPDGLYIDGAWRAGEHPEPLVVVSPRDGTPIATITQAAVADVDRAVAAARHAFDDGPWPRLAPRARAAHLLRLATLLERDRARLALLVALEMGKPISYAYEIELRAITTTLRWYAELADKQAGEVSSNDPDAVALVTREPAGVVAAVVPWNFPLTIAGWKIAPALAAGCTLVLKPSELSPLSALALAGLVDEAGLPPGVFNVVVGDGPLAGRTLGEHPGVDVLTFTGSTAVGREFLRYSAGSNLKRVGLELGGKSANIVLPDAPDLDAAARSAAWAVLFNSGEMCTAGSRLLVHESIADEFTERVVTAAGDWIPADPLQPDSRLGPLVREAHLARVEGLIERAGAEGAQLRTGGVRALPETGGSYLAPTVFSDVRRDSELATTEVFGPVLAVLPFRDAADAIALANATDYGLAAAVWTADLSTAHRMSRALRAGTVWVNCYEEGDNSVPFGGVKLSGNGRDKSVHALDKFTDLKTTWIAL